MRLVLQYLEERKDGGLYANIYVTPLGRRI